MFFTFLNIINFPLEIFSGIIAGLVCRSYYINQTKNKIKGYQNDIVKSYQRIQELEDLNDKLEKRLKDFESQFSKDKISLN